jgi:predicted nuclease with TOPRIM domain
MTSPTIETDLGKILDQINKNLVEFRKEANENLAEFRKETNENLAEFRKETNENLAEFRREANENLAEFRKEVTHRFDKIDERLNRLEIGQARLEERVTGEVKALEAKVDGLGKRLDTQEFINRSVFVGLVLAIAAGVVKLFFPGFPNNP